MHVALFLLAAWIGTWATAPAYADSAKSFQGDTLREVVHVSIGGSQVRVRFTNRFGDVPLTIGAAAIAVKGSGASPLGGTEHDVTFAGARSVTIPPNADVYSDPVTVAVAPQSDLLVDLYLPGPPAPATVQPLAYQTNYYAVGNRAGENSAEGFAYTYTSWYFLAGVDVAGAPAPGAVVAFGDSITLGAGGTTDANDRWPDFLAARLLSRPAREHLGVLNAGLSGNRILLSYPTYGIDALARLDSDVLSQSGVVTAIVLLGINDIQEKPHQYDPARIEQGLAQIVTQAHVRGLRVMGCTLTPYQGWFAYEAAGEATRLAVNEFIRRSGTFDGIADFDAALRDPQDVHRLLPAYDSGDHLHPNANAHRVMAATVNLLSL